MLIGDSLIRLSFGQNLKADKIILSDSDLTNLYQIDSGVYRSEQPSKEGFKALEKYGIGEVLNLRNRHSDDDEAKGTSIKLHRVKTKAHSISEKQLIQALRIIKNRKASIVFHCHHGSDRTGAVCAFYRIIFRMFQKKMQSMKWLKEAMAFIEFIRILLEESRKQMWSK